MKKYLVYSNFFFAVSFAIATTSTPLTGSHAAPWLAPAAADHVTADWVKQIEADLTGKQYQDVLLSIPAETPVPAILHLLNQADLALTDNKPDYAGAFVDDAIRVLDRGVAKGWYAPADIEPVKTMIKQRAGAAIEGKPLAGVVNPRWSGYTGNQPLGLTNAVGDKQQSAAFPEAAPDRTQNPKQN